MTGQTPIKRARGVHMRGRNIIAGTAVIFGIGMTLTTSAATAQTDAVTFTKDIAPILQRS